MFRLQEQGENECELEPFSVCGQLNGEGWVATLEDHSEQFLSLHQSGELQQFLALDLFSKSNCTKLARFDGWSDKMLKGFEGKVGGKPLTEMMSTLMKIRAI